MVERPERATRAYRGAGILGLALLLWSGPASPMLWTLAAAWLLAWLAFELAARMRIERSRLRLTRSAALLAGLAVLVWSVLRFAPVGERFLLYEGLRGAWENTADRLRLERLPSVAPPVVFGDRPQELYIHAPNAARVSLGLGPAGPVLEAVAVGQGLFRVAYDPRFAPRQLVVALAAAVVLLGLLRLLPVRVPAPPA